MNWHVCTIHPWVLATIDKGYRLQFPVKPPVFNGAVISVAQGESACVLKEEKASLLKKRVIRIIPMKERQQGFYSRYSVIPKKGGNHCPIVDLQLSPQQTKMLSCQNICQGDCAQEISEICISECSIRVWENSLWLLSSSEDFHQMCRGGSDFVRVRVLSYLDDLLVCAQSPHQAVLDTNTLVTHLERLGFKINRQRAA